MIWFWIWLCVVIAIILGWIDTYFDYLDDDSWEYKGDDND